MGERGGFSVGDVVTQMTGRGSYDNILQRLQQDIQMHRQHYLNLLNPIVSLMNKIVGF